MASRTGRGVAGRLEARPGLVRGDLDRFGSGPAWLALDRSGTVDRSGSLWTGSAGLDRPGGPTVWRPGPDRGAWADLAGLAWAVLAGQAWSGRFGGPGLTLGRPGVGQASWTGRLSEGGGPGGDSR